MININFYLDGYEVCGHANYDDYGKDIVCAAISTIAMGSLNWFEKKDIVNLTIDEQKPIIKAKFNLNDKNTIALSLIKSQFKEVYLSYSKYIKFIDLNKKMEA